MALLKILLYISILTFPLLELARVSFSNGVSLSLLDVITGIIFIYFYTLFFSKRIKIHGKLFKPILYFFVVAIVSLLVNVFNFQINQIAVGFLYLVRWFAYATLYLVIVSIDKSIIKKVPKLLLVAGSLILLISYLQYAFYQNLGNLFYLGWDKHLYRLFGTFFDPNYAGIFFSVFAIYALRYTLSDQSAKRKTVYLLVVFLSILAVVLTFSRTALLTLIMCATVVLFLTKRTKYILVFLLFLFLMIISSPRIFQSEGTNLFRSASTIERVKSMKNATEIFRQNIILGVGFNTYRYAQYKHGFLAGPKWLETHSGSGAENSYLLILATTGVIGAIAYTYLLRSIYSLCISVKNKQWKLVSVSTFFGILVSALFINSLFYPAILFWFWIITGLTENS